MLLIHWPTAYPNKVNETQSYDTWCNTSLVSYNEKECRLSTWRSMIYLWEIGLTKAIGVSNYNITHLMEIKEAGLVMPSINQCHFHIYSA